MSNSRFGSALELIWGFIWIAAGIVGFILPDINEIINHYALMSIGAIAYGAGCVVEGALGLRGRIFACVFFIPCLICAAFFFTQVGLKAIF